MSRGEAAEEHSADETKAALRTWPIHFRNGATRFQLTKVNPRLHEAAGVCGGRGPLPMQFQSEGFDRKGLADLNLAAIGPN